MKITKNTNTKGIFPELRGNLGAIRYPCFAEIKFDGEATIIMYDYSWPTPIITTNKYGTMRSSWSKLDQIVEILEKKNITKAIFLAELYYNSGKAGALYGLLSHKDSDDLNLTIYDFAKLNLYDGTQMPLIDRKELLNDIFQPNGFGICSHVCLNKEGVESLFNIITQTGFEGIVVKNFDSRLFNGPCDWAKMKHKDQTAYQISVIDNIKERIEVKVPIPQTAPVPLNTSVRLTPQGNWIAVGVKAPNKIKKTLNVGDMVIIEHQGVLDSGSLRHPVLIGKEQV